MKQITLLFFLKLLVIAAFAQINPDSIEYLPEKEKAAALLSLAKANYTSQLDMADEYSRKALLIASKLDQHKEMGLASKYLGITDYFRKNYVSALVHYQTALAVFEDLQNEKEQANVINNIALIYSDRSSYDTAIVYHKRSLKLREALNDAYGIIGSLNNIGNLYQDKNEPNKSLEYYNQAMGIAELVFPEQEFTSLLGGMAKAYAETGNVTEAVLFYEKAIHAAIVNQDVRSEINNRNNLGNLFYHLGESDQSIFQLTEAYNLAHDHQLDYLEAVTKLNIGNIYTQMNDYEKAAGQYKAALSIQSKINDPEGNINALINLALAEENLGLADSAKIHYLLAREIAERTQKPDFLALTANYLGKYYLKTNENNKAFIWLTKALSIAEKRDIWRELYMAHLNLGDYWFNQNDFNNAETHFKTALQLAQESKSVIKQKDAATGLWQAYQKLNNYEKALEYLLIYSELNDSVFNQEAQKQVLALEAKFNFELKENQISSQEKIIDQQLEILRQERKIKLFIVIGSVLLLVLLLIFINREKIRREKEKADLIQQNLTTERDLLQLQMNPHFIFNALNSIQSFISENNSFEAEMFLSKFARLMRYYLDSSSKKWVDFNDEIQAIELNLELEKLRLNDHFVYNIIIDEQVESEEIQIPPMLLQPFIENAIKHGLRPKAEKGRLEIGFKQIKGFLLCYIEDDGVGRRNATGMKVEKSGHLSKGVELTRKRLLALNPDNPGKNVLSIFDLKSKNGIPVGTRVELFIPFRYF